jgi:hypothetical protein
MNRAFPCLWYVATALATSLVGCATSPDNVKPAYVSPLAYAAYDCDQLQAEIIRLQGRVSDTTSKQRSAASSDTVATTVGILLFWPALFILAADNDQSDELSRLKGEYEAAEKAAVSKSCSYSSELLAARAQAEQEASEAVGGTKEPTDSGEKERAESRRLRR